MTAPSGKMHWSRLWLFAGETKYIGIPTSDLFYASGSTVNFKCHLHPAHIGGKLVLIKRQKPLVRKNNAPFAW